MVATLQMKVAGFSEILTIKYQLHDFTSHKIAILRTAAEIFFFAVTLRTNAGHYLLILEGF
jgi:hypothetical protein